MRISKAVLSLLSCLPVVLAAHTVSAQCRNDNDCKGNRICVHGSCDYPRKSACNKDTDCPGDLICKNNSCESDSDDTRRRSPETVTFKISTKAKESVNRKQRPYECLALRIDGKLKPFCSLKYNFEQPFPTDSNGQPRPVKVSFKVMATRDNSQGATGDFKKLVENVWHPKKSEVLDPNGTREACYIWRRGVSQRFVSCDSDTWRDFKNDL